MNMLTRIDKTVQIKGQNRALKETATLIRWAKKIKKQHLELCQAFDMLLYTL